MAEYTNLASLAGLAAGDIVTYDATTAIDFAGAKVKVQIYGKRVNSTSSLEKNAGLTELTIDTKLLPETILSFNKDNLSGSSESQYATRGDLIYGDSDSLYYRIAVAGNSGVRYYYNGSYSIRGGAGGGSSGQDGSRTTSYGVVASTAGTQTSGGKSGTVNGAAIGGNGTFGAGGSTVKYTRGGYPYGGYGWYGGASGSTTGSTNADGISGAGGSGFVIGYSTTTYPSGYLGDDVDLQNTIAAAISDASLTQGGSTETTPKMILTIIEEGGSGPSEPTASIIQVYQNQQFNDANAYIYKDGEFRLCDVYRYNGSEFVKI